MGKERLDTGRERNKQWSSTRWVWICWFGMGVCYCSRLCLGVGMSLLTWLVEILLLAWLGTKWLINCGKKWDFSFFMIFLVICNWRCTGCCSKNFFFATIVTLTSDKNHASQTKFMKWPLPQQPWLQPCGSWSNSNQTHQLQNQQLPSPMLPEHGCIN